MRVIASNNTLVALIALVSAGVAAAELKVDVYDGPKECDDAQKAKKGNLLTMHYTGTIDQSSATGEKGSKFESTRDREEPFEFQIGVGHVIKGWNEGMVGLCVGAKANLIVPPEMAYGEQGAAGAIPGGATLHFDVEVIAIKDGPSVTNIFNEIDTNLDGKLDKDEAEAYLTKNNHGEMSDEDWEKEDTDGDGAISWDEFSGPKGDVNPMGDEL